MESTQSLKPEGALQSVRGRHVTPELEHVTPEQEKLTRNMLSLVSFSIGQGTAYDRPIGSDKAQPRNSY